MRTLAVLFILAALAVLLTGCSTLDRVAEFSQEDAKIAADIAAEWGDEVGFACFGVLAERKIIAPVGPLSTIAAARAARLGRPPACDSVLLDVQRRVTPWGL